MASPETSGYTLVDFPKFDWNILHFSLSRT